MIDEHTLLRIKRNDETLIILILSCKNIGSEDAKALAEALKTNTMLTTIDLYDNNIGSEGAKSLVEALKTNTTLTTLYLNGNNIGSEGAKSLADALKTNATLNTLDLYDNKIGSEGAKALADALKTNTTLNTLNLSYNSIGAEGSKVLVEALKTNTTLTTLNLNGNNIGSEGAKSLLEALKTNTTLTTLYLNGNNIGSEGAKSLADALKTNATLNTLDLYDNKIGSEGAKALADALKTNTTLNTLNLSYNSIGAEGAKALAEALKTNTTLTALNLGFNSIGAEGLKSLAEGLKTNTTLRSIVFDGISSIHAKEIENHFVRNQKIAKCLKPLEVLQEDPDSLYSLIDNNYSRNLEELKTLYPALNNKAFPTDENPFIFEAFSLLSALAYTTNDDIDSQLIALRCLMFSFEAKKHQKIAEVLRYKASHKLYATMMDVNLTLEEKQALLLLIVHCIGNYVNKEDSNLFIADTLLQLQNPDKTVTVEHVTEFNQSVALLNYNQALFMAKQALVFCESDKNTNSNEINLLRKLADQVDYNDSVLPCLFKSPVFYNLFKQQYSQDKYILIEDVCSKTDFKEKEVPESPSVVTEEQAKEVEKTLFDSQETKITENIEQLLQEIENVSSKKSLNEKEVPESPSVVTEEQTKEVEKTLFDSQETKIAENIEQPLQKIESFWGANASSQIRNDNSRNSDKKSVIGKTFGLVLVGLGAAVVIAGIATLFATVGTISLPLSASLIGLGGVLLTTGFIIFEASQNPTLPLNSNTKSVSDGKDQRIPEKIIPSQDKKVKLIDVSNNKQSFFSKRNTENSKLLNDSPGDDSTKRPVFKNG